jgi:general secretion pathway protein G
MSIKRTAVLRCRGLTLVELMIVLAIIGTLAAIAMPTYSDYVTKVRVKRAVIEMRGIAQEISDSSSAHGQFPATLSALGRRTIKDPWGNDYQYLRFTPQTPKGKMRKDKSLIPVNTDYDLYSMGRDGKSALAFTSAAARDDVVRANNGGYYGLAGDY